LTAAEVETVLVQGIKQALITRALIHQPVGSHIEVSVGVCDENGVVVGAASTLDAPISSYDISVQKARSAAFFSNPSAATRLRNGGLGKYVDAANREGLSLNGGVAISGRCLIFLSRPFLPDGIDGTENGPFSNPIEDNSAFNTGLQLDTVLGGIVAALGPYLTTGVVPPKGAGCSPIIGAENGFQVRQASVRRSAGRYRSGVRQRGVRSGPRNPIRPGVSTWEHQTALAKVSETSKSLGNHRRKKTTPAEFWIPAGVKLFVSG
jgi:uncharacterized protein GlcG (DUF336 family)